MGTSAITAAAELPPQSTDTVPTKPAIPSGTVWVEVLERVRANRNSFQENSRHNIAVAASPGRVRGNATRVNTPVRLQPSTWAAASSSAGTSAKNDRISQTTS